MSQSQLKPEDATWWDHHEMTFWLWSFFRDAEIYFTANQAQKISINDIFSRPMTEWQAAKLKADALGNEVELATYHLITTMGVLIRVLKRAQHLFPQIQPPYSRANHLLKEGMELRGLIEHAYGENGYLAGGGKNPEKFERVEAGAKTDAVSTILRDDGHWIGNRLCVEKILDEILAIKSVADTIEAPVTDE